MINSSLKEKAGYASAFLFDSRPLVYETIVARNFH